MEHKVTFNLYRYQILPINRKIDQPDLLPDGEKTIDDLLEKKNNIFQKALMLLPEKTKTSNSFRFYAKPTRLHENEAYLFKIQACNREKKVEQNFKKITVPNQPSIWMAIHNDPEIQIIAIEKSISFSSSETVAINAVQKAINKILKNRNLHIKTETIKEQNSFWNYIASNKEEICGLNFELITPNMSNVSACLSDQLKELMKDANSSKTDLGLQTDGTVPLFIDPSNETIQSLVDYSDKGAGNYSFKLIRKGNQKFHPKNFAKTIKAIVCPDLADEMSEDKTILGKIIGLFRK